MTKRPGASLALLAEPVAHFVEHDIVKSARRLAQLVKEAGKLHQHGPSPDALPQELTTLKRALEVQFCVLSALQRVVTWDGVETTSVAAVVHELAAGVPCAVQIDVRTDFMVAPVPTALLMIALGELLENGAAHVSTLPGTTLLISALQVQDSGQRSWLHIIIENPVSERPVRRAVMQSTAVRGQDVMRAAVAALGGRLPEISPAGPGGRYVVRLEFLLDEANAMKSDTLEAQ